VLVAVEDRSRVSRRSSWPRPSIPIAPSTIETAGTVFELSPMTTWLGLSYRVIG
jgi:hypothetical protein